MTAGATRSPASLPVGEIEEFFSARAEPVDRGEGDVRDGLRYLAELGLLGHPDLRVSCELITTVARSCLASAFSLWAHTMVVEYLSAASSPWLGAQIDRLRAGEQIGSTAMAPAMQNLVGLADLGTRFARDGDALVVDGHIRWASNLFADGFVVVLGAGSDDGERVIIAVPSETPGLRTGAALDLLALGATQSSNLVFDGVRVEGDWVLSTQFEAFLGQIKPPFLLLQSSFCLGLAQAALAGVNARVSRSFEEFRHQHTSLAAELRGIEQRHDHLIGERGPVRAVVEHRLRAATAAQAAVALELRVAGGAGYQASSATARRVREAAFLPIQSPTEGHLRWELSRPPAAAKGAVASAA